MELEDLYVQHKNLGLPEFPEDEKFAEWVEELIAIDAYYAGLVSSLLNGSKASINNDIFIRANESLKRYRHIKEDENIYDQCLKYMESLGVLIEAVRKQYDGVL